MDKMKLGTRLAKTIRDVILSVVPEPECENGIHCPGQEVFPKEILRTHGDILFRGSGGLTRLPPGTSGDYLETRGEGADPRWSSVAAGAATREFFYPVNSRSTVVGIGWHSAVLVNGPSEYGYIECYIPHDFSSLTDIVLVHVPQTDLSPMNCEGYSDYAAVGEAYNTHTLASQALSQNTTANDITELDISSLVTALAAGDYLGVIVGQAALGDNMNSYILGVRLRYT